MCIKKIFDKADAKYSCFSETALKGGQKLGVSPVLEARDLANPNVEYLGVMAWAAQFQVPSKPQRRVPGSHGVGRTVPDT
jgi:hypothetical protein